MPFKIEEIMCTLHEDRKFMISRRILIRMRNVSDKMCREIQNTYLCSITFFSENRAFYEILWKNMAESDRQQMTIHYDACALHGG